VDAIAAAVKALSEHHTARRVVLVGHSGAAAIPVVILGRHPRVADGALLVACPCDLTTWRVGRKRWTNSLSPDEYIKQVPATARVVAMTGENDGNTRPALAQDYVNDLAKRGIRAKYVGGPGTGHNDVIHRPELPAAIDDLLA